MKHAFYNARAPAAHSSVAARPRPWRTRVQRVFTEITQSRYTRMRIVTLLAFVTHLHYRRRLNPLETSSSSGPLQRCKETQSDGATAMGMGGHALQLRGPNCDVEGSAARFRCPQIIQMYVDPTLIGLDSSLIRPIDIGTLLCTTIIRTFSGVRKASAQYRHAKERGTGVRVHVLQPRGPSCDVEVRVLQI
jgi:hypothetical protein